MSELINASLIKALDESLSGSLIYFISIPYSYKIRRQRSAFSVVDFSKVGFLWSIYTILRCPKIIERNSFRVSNILNSYLYVVIYLFCAGVNLRE